MLDAVRAAEQRSWPADRAAAAPDDLPALLWPDALAEHREGGLTDAELACVYITGRVRARAGSRWLQAQRHPRLACASPSPWVRLFAERELYRTPRAVHDALVGWAAGQRPLKLLFHVPSPRDVLALQARGRRCVSLLAPGVDPSPHEDGLAFATHDLCHIEKFMAPEHHQAQVGFFALVDRAMGDPRWEALEQPFDSAWAADRDHVIADMNGSAAFLFVALKNKLKLAVRRRLAQDKGAECPASGPLDPHEASAYEQALEVLFDLLELDGESLDAAWALSSRRSTPDAAGTLVGRFDAIGAAVAAAERVRA